MFWFRKHTFRNLILFFIMIFCLVVLEGEFDSLEILDSRINTISNPAAAYCNLMGYEYQTTSTSGGVGGYCLLPDQLKCNAWDFYAGKCGNQYSWCEQNGYSTITLSDGNDSYNSEYAACSSNGKGIVGNVPSLSGLNDALVQSGCDRADSTLIIPTDAKLRIIETDTAMKRPSSFDWRNYNGVNWMTPIKDQGRCGSCWAFSALGGVEAVFNIKSNNPSLDLNLSEQYFISSCFSSSSSNIHNCCGGVLSSTFFELKRNGVPDENCMKYVDGTGCACSGGACTDCTYKTNYQCSDRTCSDKCNNYKDRMTYILDYVRLYSVPSSQAELNKQALITYGPLVSTMGIGSSLGGYFDGDIYRCSNDDVVNHGVVIVGYNDLEKYWIVRNSWGTSWADGGYMKVGYGECRLERYPYAVFPLRSQTYLPAIVR